VQGQCRPRSTELPGAFLNKVILQYKFAVLIIGIDLMVTLLRLVFGRFFPLFSAELSAAFFELSHDFPQSLHAKSERENTPS
jgi:hypothetical protein